MARIIALVVIVHFVVEKVMRKLRTSNVNAR